MDILGKWKDSCLWRHKAVRNHSFSVVGLHRGVGVTLFCVNFASYLAKVHKAKVALINLVEHDDYIKLASAEGMLEDREAKQCFYSERFMNGNITFFCNANTFALQRTWKETFDFVLYDMGTKFHRNKETFLSSDQKIILGSGLQWRNCEYEQFLHYARQEESYHSWEYVIMALTCNKATFIDDGKIKLKRMGVLPGAFDVSDDAARLYRSFL